MPPNEVGRPHQRQQMFAKRFAGIVKAVECSPGCPFQVFATFDEWRILIGTHSLDECMGLFRDGERFEYAPTLLIVERFCSVRRENTLTQSFQVT